MGFSWLFLVALLGVVLCDDSCPSPEDLRPCTCDGEGVNCMEAKSLADIKRAFSAKFKYGLTRSVWVQGTPITSLPAGLFGKVKSRSFFIELNNISTIELDAFSASKDTMSSLSLFGNKISEFPFAELRDYSTLSNLNLGSNLIEIIPDNAFQHENLFTIILSQNKIRHIGSNAFANLPRLAVLELSYNKLITIGPYAFASKQHTRGLRISLYANQIDDVYSTAFDGTEPYAVFFSANRLKTLKKEVFEPLVTKAAQQGGFLEVSNNQFTCQGCDFSWIALNKELLAQKLVGFKCEDGTSIHDLSKLKIGC